MLTFARLLRLLLLAQVTLLVWPEQQQLRGPTSAGISLVQCSSSYIDDYFLPTAKIAFNKIQQQFTPSSASIPTTTTTSETPLSKTTSSSSPASSSAIQQQQQQQGVNEPQRSPSDELNREPNKSEFVNLELGKPRAVDDLQLGSTQTIDVSSESGSKKAAVERDDERDATSGSASTSSSTIVSATESTSVDPTSSLLDVAATSSSSTQDPDQVDSSGGSQQLDEVNERQQQQQVELGKPTAQQEEAVISNQIDAKSATDETVRETELEAIGAVEASIGFGDSALFGGSAPTDACYDEYGNARYCEPEFENVAFERQVDTSSQCGAPPSRFCTAYLNERGDQIRNCHICDQQHLKKRHPAAFLTDINNSNQPTCWVSGPIGASSQPASGSNNNNNTNEPLKRDNVTLTLNFDKRYELTYISLQFCSLKPDSLAILKSADFGKSWQAYQFYSSQCGRFYGRPTSTSSVQLAGRDAESAPIEATCLNSSTSGQSNNRIAFSTLDVAARAINSSSSPSLAQVDKSQPLQDWLSATNIRIVLDQHQASWIQSSLAYHAHSQPARAQSNNNTVQGEQAAGSKTPADALESSLTKPSDTYNYAISDLTIGGRCKCNGHASRCVHNADGRLQCDCQHNTDGPDCERCLPLHHDRPWQRATQANANPCQPCNCNGHSRKCRFDSELYQLSGRRSGGVCIDCKDNTTGRHCHYCKEGFTRDHSRSMSDKEACKPCDCHPVGSVGKVCNQTSGQCPCKEGVTGLECNRCAPGYQQSSSPSEPCIKLPENDINYEPSIETASEEPASVQQVSAADPSSEPAIAPLDEDPSIVTQSAPQKPFKSAANSKDAAQVDLADSAANQAGGQFDPDGSDAASPTHQQQAPMSTRHHYSKANAHRTGRPQGNNKWKYYPKTMSAGRRYSAPPVDEYPVEELPEGFVYYSPNYGYARFPKQHFKPQAGYSKRERQPELFRVAPIARLDHDQPDDFAGGQRDDALGYEPSSGMSALYADDAQNFNQIHGTNSLQAPPAMRKGRPQGQAFYLAGAQGGRNGLALESAQASQMRPAQQANTLACAECQPATKRLNFRQFCQLDYAIKATILSKQVAQDWTKFEVEIQDIFKSASSSAMLLHRSQRHFLLNSDSTAQSQQAIANAKNSSSIGESTKSAASGEQQVGSANSLPAIIQELQPRMHRAFKVGSLQTIWIPTEDVECKCPRLKLRSTYLLMGLLDTKENSATSIQLDRHGVALEWRARWQEKLVKYQRRHSRGAC